MTEDIEDLFVGFDKAGSGSEEYREPRGHQLPIRVSASRLARRLTEEADGLSSGRQPSRSTHPIPTGLYEAADAGSQVPDDDNGAGADTKVDDGNVSFIISETRGERVCAQEAPSLAPATVYVKTGGVLTQQLGWRVHGGDPG